MYVVDLVERRAKDLTIAKKKLETKQKVATANDSSKRKEQKYEVWREKQSEVYQKMEGDTVHRTTEVYELNKITPTQRRIQEERRSKMGAHSRTVAGGARDLQHVGRAVPSWTSGARHHMT